MLPSIRAAGGDENHNDRKAEDVLKKMSSFYRGLKQFAVDIRFVTLVEAPGLRRELWSEYAVAIERPNKASFLLKDGAGIILVSDGKTYNAFLPPMKRFTQKPASPNFEEFFKEDESALLTKSMGNLMFIDVLLKPDPFATMKEGGVNIQYGGTESLGEMKTHRVTLNQLGMTLELWIQDGKEPLLRKVRMDMSKALGKTADGQAHLKDSKMEISVKLDNWNVNNAIPADTFSFTPPLDAQKVSTLFEVEEEKQGMVGKAAPDFKIDLVGGGTLDLADHKEKSIVILEFWATWCAPCVKGLPIVSEIANTYKDRGVHFFAINQNEEPEVIQAFMKKKNLANVKVAVDRDGKVAGKFGLAGIPFTIIIGKDGKVQAMHMGLAADFKERICSQLDMLLSGKTLVSQPF